jgi:hypothetical protein
MPTIITKVQEQLNKKKNILPHGREAQNWLLEKVKNLRVKGIDRQRLLSEGRTKNKTIIGRFYFYFYDAKHKEELPYFDKFPMVVPIEQYPDGFLGLNLHYIPPRDRLILLTQLQKFANGSLNDERTRLRLSYPILRAAHNAYRATPCVKRYLTTHIKSRVIEIPANEWHIAAALPLQKFSGAPSSEVWSDSKEKY